MPEIDDNQLMWLEDDGEEELQPQQQLSETVAQLAAAGARLEQENNAAVAALEDELQRTRKELMDVRKELAAKTVQLSRKEVVVSHEKVAELAAHVAVEKDKQLASLAAHVEHLEAVLGQKEEELEESKRMYTAQKRALREALAAAAEAEAAERQADEARARTAVAQVVEEELEKLQHELALLQARYNLEMRARDAELQSLRSELQAANTNRKQAVAAAEAALTEAWQAEVARATEEAHARVAQLEAEMARVRQQLEEHARNTDAMSLVGELASLNQQKVAIQREFDAFREMATAASRQNREEAARLLEENAALKSRLAARAFQDVQAGFKPHSKVFTALTPQSGLGGAGSAADVGLVSGGGWGEQLPAMLARLERQRKGLVPALIIGSVLALFLLVAVVRAAAVTRSEHRGGLCFLAHLGINLGKGCGPDTSLQTRTQSVSEELGHLLDEAPRVHDLEAVAEDVAAKSTTGVAAAVPKLAAHTGATAQGAAGGGGAADAAGTAGAANGAGGGGVVRQTGATKADAGGALEVQTAGAAAGGAAAHGGAAVDGAATQSAASDASSAAAQQTAAGAAAGGDGGVEEHRAAAVAEAAEAPSFTAAVLLGGRGDEAARVAQGGSQQRAEVQAAGQVGGATEATEAAAAHANRNSKADQAANAGETVRRRGKALLQDSDRPQRRALRGLRAASSRR